MTKEEERDDFGSFVSETTAKSSHPLRWSEMFRAKSEKAAEAMETAVRSVLLRNLHFHKSDCPSETSGTRENEERKDRKLC